MFLVPGDVKVSRIGGHDVGKTGGSAGDVKVYG